MLAIELNEAGIGLLKAGKYGDAIAQFATGLKEIRAHMLRLELEEEFGGVKAVPIHISFSQDGLHDENAAFLFSFPLSISLSSPKLDYKALAQLSFATLFNMGLAYQIWGNGSVSRDRLRRSLAFYDLACNIHQEENFDLCPTQVMAVLNNLGLVHRSLDNPKMALAYFGQLLNSIIFVQQSGQAEPSRIMDGFVSNVLPLMLQGSGLTTIEAAAAA